LAPAVPRQAANASSFPAPNARPAHAAASTLQVRLNRGEAAPGVSAG